MEKEPDADRAFAKLAPKFVILYFDTRNGRAPHVARLRVKRNQTYALVLRPDSTEIARIEKPADLKPVVVLLKKALKQRKAKPDSGRRNLTIMTRKSLKKGCFKKMS